MYKTDKNSFLKEKITWREKGNILLVICMFLLASWLFYMGLMGKPEPERKPDQMQGWQKPTASDTLLIKEILTPPGD